MEGNTSKPLKGSSCLGCEKPVVNIENKHVVEENNLIIDSDQVAPQSDTDIFD